eukprot:6188996-Pleurochrysis_carterae.AAC.2
MNSFSGERIDKLQNREVTSVYNGSACPEKHNGEWSLQAEYRRIYPFAFGIAMRKTQLCVMRNT